MDFSFLFFCRRIIYILKSFVSTCSTISQLWTGKAAYILMFSDRLLKQPPPNPRVCAEMTEIPLILQWDYLIGARHS